MRRRRKDRPRRGAADLFHRDAVTEIARPLPQYSSSTVMPSRPSSPRCATDGAGKCSSCRIYRDRRDLVDENERHGVAQRSRVAEIEIERGIELGSSKTSRRDHAH